MARMTGSVCSDRHAGQGCKTKLGERHVIVHYRIDLERLRSSLHRNLPAQVGWRFQLTKPGRLSPILDQHRGKRR